MLFSLVYKSQATNEMDTTKLESIIEQSVKRNESLNITGVLLSDGYHFLQYLEGPREAVEKLYNLIGKSTSHTDLERIFFAPVSKREFPKWFMGLIQPSTSELLNLMHWEWWDAINDNPISNNANPGVQNLKNFCEQAGAEPMGSYEV